MRKDFEDDMIVTPLPVLMIATYDEEGRPDVMPCAWGGQCGAHQVAVNLGSHQTTENIKARKAFTLSFARFPIISALFPQRICRTRWRNPGCMYLRAPMWMHL